MPKAFAVGAAAVAGSLMLPAAAPAKAREEAAQLRVYLVHVHRQFDRYRAVLAPLDQLDDPSYPENQIPPLFKTAADETRELMTGWRRIHAPRRLRTAHAGRAVSLRLQSAAFRLFADAYDDYLTTRDPRDLKLGWEGVAPLSAEATRLQLGWARALRSALRRAQLPAPGWLSSLP